MNINLINPLVLAYIGDAIYEVKVRKMLIDRKINKVNDLQKESVRFVSAKGQASFVNKLLTSNVLTDTEIDMYKRGRNSKVNSHPHNTDIITYKEATGFEAIIGYLYLTDNLDRIDELFKFILED